MVRVLITGGSRGIGAAVARVFAREWKKDAIVTVTGRSLSAPSHSSLQGTILDTVRDVESFGGCGIALEADLRCADEVVDVAQRAIDAMGGLDVLVNNASVLYLDRAMSPKRMDLLHAVNTRATILFNQTCRAALEDSHGSIVTLSPPVRLTPLDWISSHPTYTISKYSMTMATLAFASSRVRANCLWPRYTVATSATRRLEEVMGVEGAYTNGRDPDDVARAVHDIAMSTQHNAQSLYDDEAVDLPSPPIGAPLDLFATEDSRHLRRG